MALFGQRISRCHAGDTAADDCEMCHKDPLDSTRQKKVHDQTLCLMT